MPKNQKPGIVTLTTYLRDRDQEIVALERNMEEISRTIAGVRAAREAMAAHVLERAAYHRSRDDGTSRAAVLQEVLAGLSEPTSVDDLKIALEKRNIFVSRAAVTQTLQYLKRKEVAKNVERGKWASITTIHKAA